MSRVRITRAEILFNQYVPGFLKNLSEEIPK